MTDAQMLRLLEAPSGPIDVVLDTDAYNEIDDQFALAYMLRAEESLSVRAIYAAPFWNERSIGPEDGMLKSYDEIGKLLRLAEREDLLPSVFHGSREYLKDEQTPVISPAARDLAARAAAYDCEHPLYVVAIGAITNVASALLIDPTIAERIVVVWLGGHAWHWPDTREFNMQQDVAAARVVFGCGAPLVQLPCMGVVSAFYVTEPELNHWLRGKNALCEYLADNTIEAANSYAAGKPWSRVIWDVTAVAWLLGGDGRLMNSRVERAPIPQYDHHFSFDPRRHLMKYVYQIHRDRLMQDLVEKLSR